MTDAQQTSLDALRSGNVELATITKNIMLKIAKKTGDMVEEAENVNDLLAASRVMETVTKTVGLSPKESNLNVSINAVNGFDFIEVDEEEIAQLTMTETFEEATYDEG
jgi:hypothetical protein